jgi:hypothetical protein
MIHTWRSKSRSSVAAGLRFCADEKPSARSCVKPRAFLVFIQNRVFCADALFIRAENTVAARSAQIRA